MPKPRANYHALWVGLISTICQEIVRLDRMGDERTVEDMWIQGTLWQVVGRMCAGERLHPSMQKEPIPMRKLFED
jgi:hypothetical protein